MGSPFHSRRHLGPFLFNLLESRKFEELQWQERNKRIFKISWMDNRKTVGSNDRNPVFKEWEIYNNRYKAGKVEKWAYWKQVFRNALNKSPDVELMESKNKSESFNVYKFVNAMPLKTHYDYNSSHQQNVFCPTTLSKENDFLVPGEDLLHKGNIPRVVMDVLNCSTNTSNETVPNCIHDPETHYSQLDDKSRNSSQVLCNNYILNSDDWNELLSLQPQETMDFSLPSFNTPEVSMESDKPFVRFKVFYSNIPVLTETIGDNGIHLYFGNCTSEAKSWMSMMCPTRQFSSFSKVKFPDAAKYQNELSETNPKSIEYAKCILKQMNRGLLLYCNDRKLFVFRLCAPRVYCWNKMTGSVMIDRRNKLEQQLFDFNIFKEQLEFYKLDPGNRICPSPTVILTFAQELSPTVPNCDKIVMRLELTYIEAEDLLMKECPKDHELQFSFFDSTDLLLLQNFESLEL